MLRLCGRPRAKAFRGAGVKLLLDENLSDTIISRIGDLFPDSTHIKAVGLKEADDFVVWEWAKKHEFTIVSKDTDSNVSSTGNSRPLRATRRMDRVRVGKGRVGDRRQRVGKSSQRENVKRLWR